MAKNILKAIFAGDDEAEDGVDDVAASSDDGLPVATGRPRSLADAWERLAEQSRRVEKRLGEVADAQREMLHVAEALGDSAKQQLEVLHVLGKFHEAAEKRGREMENQMRGVPDVLRTLPTATKEQAERLSEIAARLYEKAQDNTVNALKSAQANHQRAIEDLIDKSIGSARTLTIWAMVLVAAAGTLMVFTWMQANGA